MKNGNVVFIDGRADPAHLATLLGIIHERVAAAARVASKAAAFDRRGRDVAAWRDHVKRVLADGGYRDAPPFTVDDAAFVMRSPLATPEQRVGAALALRVAGEPKERVRVASDAIADDRLRVAVDAIADDDDDRVEKALRAMAVRG
jgi:hypothetical protein